MEYFFGAFYLFLISHSDCDGYNAGGSYLNFPPATFVDAVLTKYKRYFAVALLALVIPSGWIF